MPRHAIQVNLTVAALAVAVLLAPQSAHSANHAPTVVTVYNLGEAITPPALLEAEKPYNAPAGCTSDLAGKVTLSAIIDDQGQAKNISFLTPLWNDLYNSALLIAKADHFQPALLKGSPVALHVALTIDMQTCVTNPATAIDKPASSNRWGTRVLQRIGAVPDAPKQEQVAIVTNPDVHPADRLAVTWKPPIAMPPPSLKDQDESPIAKSGTVIVSFVVDSNGMPRDLKVSQSTEQDLDNLGLDMARRLRFKPATLKGAPASAAVSMRFKLDKR